MKLKEWMKKNNKTVREMQNELRYGRDYLYKVVGEKIIPGKKLATSISEYTEGKVSIKDLGYKEKEKCKCPHCGRLMQIKNPK